MADEVAWVGQAVAAVSGIGGVAIGMLSSFFVQSRERKWRLADEGRRLKIERGEELHSLVKKWWANEITWFSHSKLCLTGNIDYNEFLDLQIRENHSVDLKVDRIELLFSVYFPEIELFWKDCISKIQDISKIENDFKRDYKDGIFSGAEKLSEMAPKMKAADENVNYTLQLIAKQMQLWTDVVITPPSPVARRRAPPRLP